jgi:hypothetical protein
VLEICGHDRPPPVCSARDRAVASPPL